MVADLEQVHEKDEPEFHAEKLNTTDGKVSSQIEEKCNMTFLENQTGFH